MKKYHVLSFQSFEGAPNLWNDEGGPFTKEEVIDYFCDCDNKPKYRSELRVAEIENKTYGVSPETLAENFSEYMKDNIYDEVCAGSDFDSDHFEDNVDSAFKDEEVKKKIEELSELINKKADITYYNYAPWESITYEELTKEEK